MSVLETIINYVEISDHLGTGGQPTAAHFGVLRDAGYQVVINLAMPDSRQALIDEGALVTSTGMLYVHLPISWKAPRLEDAQCLFGLLDHFRNERVFVHCIKNMRVSALVFAYRVCRLAVPIRVAESDMLRVWRPSGVWRKLLDRLLSDAGLKYD